MKALIVVDVQNDFLPGGALAVPDGDQVIEIINQLMRRFERVVATQDWHPADHGSFASRHPGREAGQVVELAGIEQQLWPDHCVQGTPGAEFAPSLDTSRFQHVVRKGVDPQVDSYSGFFDNEHRRETGLADWLREHQVTEVFIAGLALDYCVQFTALDARRLGFATRVIVDACRGIDQPPGNVVRARDAMRQAGVEFVESREIGNFFANGS